MAGPLQQQQPQEDKRYLANLPSFSDSVVASGDETRHDSGEEDDGGSGDFEFAVLPALTEAAGAADDLFSNGRIVRAYPVFDRQLLSSAASSPVNSPEAGEYCEWTPRSAPGSPARSFPKSSSTGEARRWWLRDLVGIGGRSHSDGKEKFVFLEKTPTKGPNTRCASDKAAAAAAAAAAATEKKKNAKKATEMDMVTAHKLFYGGGGDRQRQQQPARGAGRKSFLPYRPEIVGLFANVSVLGRSHHPY